MVVSRTLTSLLDQLGEKEQFISNLKGILDKVIEFINDIDQVREELMIYDYDGIYQLHISDLSFDCWINIQHARFSYDIGLHPNPSVELCTTKNITIKLIKNEINLTHAYMKGQVQIQGSLTDAIKMRNLRKFFINYFGKIFTF